MLSLLMQKVGDASRDVAPGGTVARSLMLARRSQVGAPLLGSPAVVDATCCDIAAARCEVLYQTFRWQDAAEPASRLRQSLVNLAASKPSKPVNVQLILRQGLRDRLGRRETRKLRALAKSLDPRYVCIEVRAHPQWVVGSLHAKSLVVDGAQAIITGSNPELSSNPPVPQFDTGYRLYGDIVRTLHADLLDVRRHTTVLASNLPRGKHYVPLPSTHVDDLCAASGATTPILFAARRANEMLRWRSLRNPQSQAFLQAIDNAKKRICIMTPNLNARPVRHALEQAAKRGVRVEVLLSKNFNDLTERFLQGGGNYEVVRRLRHFLVRHGDKHRDSNFFVRWFCHAAPGVPTCGNVPGASHAKGAAFDDQLLAIGSANMDTQSFFHSREINLFIDSKHATRAWLDHVFEPRFRDGAHA